MRNKKMLDKKLLLTIFIFLFLFIIICTVSTASSVLLSDQGTDVRNKSGSLLEIGNLTITIYDNATGGNLIYNKTFPDTIANGSWNLMISPTLEFGNIYWKDYSINEQDLDFDGIERLNFQSPLGLINNVSFINFSLINSCPTGSSIRLIYANGSVECEIDDSNSTEINLANYALKNQSQTFEGNITTAQTGFFGWLGSIIQRITKLFVQDIDASGNINVTGNVTASYFKGDGSLLQNLPAGTESDPIFVNENSTLWSAINSKLTGTDQRYNETILILSVNTTSNIMGLEFYNKSEVNNLISVVGNSSWNQSRADTLYYSITNPLNFINATIGQFFNDTTLILTVNSSLWAYINTNETGWLSTYNATYSRLLNQNCPAGQVVNGTLANGTFICATPTAVEIEPAWNGNYTIFTGLINNGSYLTTYNVTYHDYALNVSKNWTEDAYNAWNTVWSSTYNSTYATNMGNASWNESMAHALFDSTFNATYAGYSANVSRNWTEDAYNAWNAVWLSTFNSTYDSYALNVSKNWTQITFDTYNATWSSSSSGDNASWNETYANTLYTNKSGYNVTQFENTGGMIHIIESWFATAWNNLFRNFFNQNLNTTSAPTFSNVTLSSGYISNGTDWFLIGDLNKTGGSTGMSSADVNTTILQYLNTGTNTSYLATYNATYDSYSINVSKNWTQITFDTYNATWDDILAGMSSADVNSTILQYLNTGTNTSYLTTYNVTYHDYATNVSKNWTQITFDTYNATWDDILAGMSSADVNSTILQYLNTGTNTSYLTTYNVTYHDYALNVSKNWTEDAYNAWNTVWSSTYNSTYATNMGNASWNESMAHALFDSTFNATYAGYSANVSRNWTEDAYNAWNAVWLSTFNSTYDSYALNVSKNWTQITFDTYNATWSSSSSGDNASWNETYANTLYTNKSGYNVTQFENTGGMIHIIESWFATAWNNLFRNFFNQNLNTTSAPTFSNVTLSSGYISNGTDWFLIGDLNKTGGSTGMSSADVNTTILQYLNTGTNTSYLATYNATYDSYSINVSKNWTQITFDTYNATWDDILAGMSSADVNSTILQYLNTGTNTSYLTTYNVTYHDYATNVSKNWTQITFDTYNATWDDILAGMSSADVNSTILQYLNTGTNTSYLTTYNVTYHDYALNVSKNWTEDAYNAWNTVWSSTYNSTYATNMGNASWNESMAHALFDSTFNATYAGYSANVSRNWTEDAYNAWNAVWLSTFNSTYDSYALNVSKNWTQITFDTYNATWSSSSSGDNASWNETYANTLYTNKSGYNVTQFENTGGMIHIIESWFATAWNNLFRNFFNQNLNTTSAPTFSNVTLSSGYISNGTDWFLIGDLNKTGGSTGMSSADVNTTILQYLNTGTNTSYLATYNATYDSYSINVSKNWTQITFDTYNATWDDILAGMSSADVNSTILQYLNTGTNTSYLTTYNVTYHDYATNVSKNWTQITFDTYNATWDDILAGMSSADVNSTILQYLNTGTNTSYLTTYNATYAGYSANVSRNWTEDAYNAWNTVWSSTYNSTYATNMGNASWNESMAHALFDSTFNATYAGYSANVSRNWTEDAYNAWNAVWLSTFNSTYASYATNVSKNWTQITFDTYNATWSSSSSGDNASWNETYANTLYTNKSGYNVTQFENTGGMIHIIESWFATAWNNLFRNFFNQNLNTTSAPTFSNVTLSSGYISNGTDWFLIGDLNKTGGSTGMSSADVNTTILQYLNTGTNTSYLATYNATYDSYSINVSKNWTQITFDTYNATWDDILAGMSSADVNSTILQYLNTGTNTSYLTTYNVTYHDYATNVSKNWTQITFDTYNATWDDILAGMSSADVNSTILQYLNTGTNTSYLTTYNATYAGYSANVSRNWTEDAYNAWNTVWISTYNATYATNMGNASWNESMAHALFDSTFNATYAGYSANVSRNWTEDAYNAWNAVWLSTFNSTYASYATNVSKNWTQITFDTYNATWSSSSSGDNASWNETYANTLYTNKSGYNVTQFENTGGMIHIIESWFATAWNNLFRNFFNQNLNTTSAPTFSNVTLSSGYISNGTDWFLIGDLNKTGGSTGMSSADVNTTILQYLNTGTNTSYLATYNATYDSYSINVSKNWTQITFDTYNATWDDILAGMSSADVNSTILQYLNTGTNTSYLTTYNVTYHDYATNVSKNWTQITFDTYNATWDDILAGMSSADVNSTILQYLNTGTNTSYLTTYNVTYHDYALNVSKNWTEDAYNAWNTVWISTYNATYATNMGNASWNESMAHALFDSTFNATYAGYSANVSRNWTEDAYNAWNAVWLSTFNSTYASYATNVSKNWTQITFDTYNATWSSSSSGDNASWNETYANTLYTNKSGYNVTQFENTGGMIHIIESWFATAWNNLFRNFFNQNLNTTSAPTFSNVTLSSGYISNGTDWFLIGDLNKTGGSTGMSSADVNSTILQYLNTGTNTSYLTTYNVTYHDYATNVSKNWTQITFDTYNATWDDILAGMSSADVNSTILQYLNTGTNTSYLTTYNATYAGYSANVSRNWTEDAYNAWNTVWSSTYNSTYATNMGNASWNESMAHALFDSTFNATYAGYSANVSRNWTEDAYNAWNAVWLSTFNSTYDSYALNVSKNWTQITFDTYNATWSSSSSGDNASWNETYANTLYTNKSGYNVTQFENTGGMIHIIESWLVNKITEIFGINFKASFDTNFTAVANVSLNQRLNSTILQYLNTGTNTSYLATYNATYDGYPTTWNSSILQYLNTGTNASYLTTYNATYVTYNTTANAQNLINNTNIQLTKLTIVNNISMSSNQSIAINGKAITSNDTCVIIKGKVSTLQIC